MADERASVRKPAVVERRTPAATRNNPVAATARPVSAARALQQRLGNRGTQAVAGRIVARSSTPGVASARTTSIGSLSISQPGDAHECEADSVADKVMRMAVPPSTSVASRGLPGAAIERKERSASAAQITPSVSASINALKGGGQPLPVSTRAFFEPRFGADFSQVRLHTDSRAADTAKSINAKAFTVGRDIAFGAGQYVPESSAGQRLLAHELTHVVQQSGAQTGVVQRWEEFEHKAAGNRAQNEFPYRGSVPTDMTALRATPHKDPRSPHANTTADIRSGAQVLVVGKEKGWLKVLIESGTARIKNGATVPAQSLTGYVSHELVKKSTAVFDAELPMADKFTLSYGDLVAMGGDHFKDFAQIATEASSPAGIERLKKLRAAVDSSATQSMKFEDENTISKEYAERFKNLALENIAHFSHGGTALATWQQMHLESVGQAIQAGMQGDSAGLGKAYAMNAVADHFLTDSFSSGHVRVPREQIIVYYKKLAVDVFGHIINHLSERLGSRIFELLRQDYARVRAFGTEEDRRDAVARVRAQITTAITRAGGAAKVQEKFGLYIAGAFSKILHDDENAAGLNVVSKKHPEGWTAFGDSSLGTAANAKNLAYMLEAVKSSKADLLNAFNIGLNVRAKHGKTPPKTAIDAAMAAVGRKVGPPYAALDWVPRPAAGVAPLPEWQWGKLDKTVQSKLVTLISKYLTASAQTELLNELPLRQEVEIRGPNVDARPRDAGRDILNELLANPIPFLERAIGRAAGP